MLNYKQILERAEKICWEMLPPPHAIHENYKLAVCMSLCEGIFERLDKLSKQLESLENTRPFFLPVPPSSIPPGTHTPPLLGPGYTAPFIGDPPNGPELTCKGPEGVYDR